MCCHLLVFLSVGRIYISVSMSISSVKLRDKSGVKGNGRVRTSSKVLDTLNT
jgi:hypothetical protein